MVTRRTTRTREPLSRERVLHASLELADEGGIGALTMHRIGRRLGVEAMSLYRHVRNKDDILDGLVELVAAEFEVPTGTPDWKASIRSSAISVHEALLRHPWASTVLESRVELGPVRLRRLDALLGVLGRAGFSTPDVIQTLMALDSHAYGFVLQEQAWPFPTEAAPARAGVLASEIPADTYPNVTSMLAFVTTTGPEGLVQFEFGLDLLLDAVERRLAAG